MRRLWIAMLLAGALCAGAFGGEEPSQDDPLVRATARLTTAPVDAVLRAMMSGDPLERRAAAIVAARRTEESPALLNELAAATGDDDAQVRLAATRGLGAAGRTAAWVIVRLARLAEHASDAAQRRAAAGALVRISPDLEASKRLLVDPSGRDLVFAGLADLGAEGVSPLVALSRSDDWRTRAAAAPALAAADATAADVRGALGELLRDDSGAVRVAALTALPTILGSGLLTTAHVERAFSGEGSERERLLTIVALAEPGLPGSATDDGAREAALRLAAAGGERRPLHAAVRMVHASGLRTDAALVTLAGIANGTWCAETREAAAALWHAAQDAALSLSVATALQIVTTHDDDEIAATAAAALAVGGRDDPSLVVPMTRLLRGRSWGPWRAGLMRSPPVSVTQRRFGLGPHPPLPDVATLTCDDVLDCLRAHPATARTALAGLLGDTHSATRCSAAWMLAEIVADPADRARLLGPLLTDVVPSVRILAALRLVDTDEHRDRSVQILTKALLADDLGDSVIHGDFEGGKHRSSPLAWADEMLDVLDAAPRVVVEAFVDVRAASISSELSWSNLPGERHVESVLRAAGDDVHLYLVDELVKGDERHRLAARLGFEALGWLSPAAEERLKALIDDPELGLDARTILERTLR